MWLHKEFNPLQGSVSLRQRVHGVLRFAGEKRVLSGLGFLALWVLFAGADCFVSTYLVILVPLGLSLLGCR